MFLISISLVANDIEYLFLCLLVSVYLLWKNVYSNFFHFKNWVICLSKIFNFHFKMFLYILNVRPLLEIWFANFFFLFYGLSFHLLDSVLWNPQVFNVEAKFIYFQFGCFAFGVISKKLLPIPSLQRFTPMFSSKYFIV